MEVVWRERTSEGEITAAVDAHLARHANRQHHLRNVQPPRQLCRGHSVSQKAAAAACVLGRRCDASMCWRMPIPTDLSDDFGAMRRGARAGAAEAPFFK